MATEAVLKKLEYDQVVTIGKVIVRGGRAVPENAEVARIMREIKMFDPMTLEPASPENGTAYVRAVLASLRGRGLWAAPT